MWKFASLVVVSVLAFAACTEAPQLSSTAGLTFDEFKAQTYKEPWAGGVYVVGGDQPYATEQRLRELWQASGGGALSVFTNGGVDMKWDASQRLNLTYCVSTRFGANKAAVEQAILEATENGWEKFADVKFVHVAAQDANCTATNNAVLFDINPVNANGQYLARAFFPNDARNVRNVLVDNSSFTGGGGDVPLKNIIAHEFGHILGFRHEHIRPESNADECVEDNNYRPLTSYDAASVMHYPQCNGTSADLSFTQRDKDGVALLYGAPGTGGPPGGSNVAPMAQINFPQDGATVAAAFTVTAQVVDDDLQDVELFVDGESVAVKATGPFTFKVSGLTTGEHTLDLTATDSEGQVTSRTVTITVDPSGPSGGNGGGLQGGEIQGGCAASHSSPGAGLALLACVVGLVGRRRRAA